MADDLDELMDRDPLSLGDKDIEAIIDYQRKYRAKKENPKAAGEAKLNLDDVVANLTKSKPQPKVSAPTTGKGLRRF